MRDVELSLNNYTKCICPVCPVQGTSECVGGKRELWREMRKSAGRVLRDYPDHPEAYGLSFDELEASRTGTRARFRTPAPGEMIEVYCSKAVGRSDCEDLDVNARCQCPTCAVWASHELSGQYYCRGGGR